MRVLIVEDQEPMQRALIDFLRSCYPGIATLTARSAASGLSQCLRHHPDLVLTDVNLLDGSGISLTAQITAQLPSTPVIVVSQHTATSYVERAKAAGARAYVSKMTLYRDLVPSIDTALAGIDRSPSEGKTTTSLLRQGKQVQLALNGSNDGHWHWHLSTGITRYSPRLNEMLGYRPQDLDARIEAFLELVHPDDRQATHEGLLSRAVGAETCDPEFRMQLKSGGYRWFRARAQAERDSAGRPIHIAGSITDITDHKLAEAAIDRHAIQQGLIAEFGELALTNPQISELLQRAVATVVQGLQAEFCRILTNNEDRSLVAASGWKDEWMSRSAHDATGEAQGRLGVGVRDAAIIEDFNEESGFSASPMLRDHGVRSGAEILICGRQEAYGVLGVYSREAHHFTLENLAFLRSIANTLASGMDRKIADERLMHMARFDALTGLPNRRLFSERVLEALTQAAQNNARVAIVSIDLDRFKIINDTLGRSSGDELLLLVAQRLLGCLRSTDIVGRLSGDEFAVVLANLANVQDAGPIAEKILTELSRSYALGGREIYVSASLGIGLYPGDGSDPDTLLKNADTAMHITKQSGRNSFQFYVAEMNRPAAERLQHESELRGALERGEFVLQYQPKVAAATGEVSGFEALLRWQHPSRGLIPPVEFIPILEDTGLIIPAGEWVAATVCKQLMRWHSEGLSPCPVAINLSSRQFTQGDFAANIAKIVESTGVNPALLELELTESVLMANPEAATKALKTLKKFGVRLSVDDFGTGYSSLAYLKRFPLDALKIDRTFINDVTSDPDAATIVLAIINLAHSLNLNVVAEGVETSAQVDFLRTHSCDEMQGYYFSRALQSAECIHVLMQGLNCDFAAGTRPDKAVKVS